MTTEKSAIELVTARIQDAITMDMSVQTQEKFWVTHYGDNEVDVRRLVYWIVVMTDREKHRLEANTALLAKLRGLLTKHDYPQRGRNEVYIGFESQETVDRESAGNFYVHWK